MRRITPVKSQEALKSDIFCLKRQLSLIVDENQLLKVKVRRLENELRRKCKYIERLNTDPRKDREARRFVYESGASMIYKLQKRNEQLEDMLLERDLRNEKRYNDMKTVCLYGHVDCKANRRGSVTNVARQNSGLGSDTNCQGSVGKINTPGRFDSRKPGRVRSSSSLKSDNLKDTKNRYCASSTGDCVTFHRTTESDGGSTRVIEILQSGRIADERVIKSKNAEISRLSAELREIKGLLRSREDSKVAKSTSTTRLAEGRSVRRGVSRDCPNFIEENKRNVSRARAKRSERKFSREPIQYSEADRKGNSKKLPTVDERNEEINLPMNELGETSSNICDNKNIGERAVGRPKTRIEYVFDSEVSSDGEEFCLSSNLRTFLQQAVNTMSSGGEGDIVSD